MSDANIDYDDDNDNSDHNNNTSQLDRGLQRQQLDEGVQLLASDYDTNRVIIRVALLCKKPQITPPVQASTATIIINNN